MRSGTRYGRDLIPAGITEQPAQAMASPIATRGHEPSAAGPAHAQSTRCDTGSQMRVLVFIPAPWAHRRGSARGSPRPLHPRDSRWSGRQRASKHSTGASGSLTFTVALFRRASRDIFERPSDRTLAWAELPTPGVPLGGPYAPRPVMSFPGCCRPTLLESQTERVRHARSRRGSSLPHRSWPTPSRSCRAPFLFPPR